MEYGLIITEIGKAKMASAQVTQTKLNINQFAVGDAEYYTPEESATALRSEVYRGVVSKYEVDSKNPNWIIVQTRIPPEVGGFYIREIGLFDDEGDLIAVGIIAESYKSLLEEGMAKELLLKNILVVSNVEIVNLAIDPSVDLAAIDYVDAEIVKISDSTDQKITQVNEQLAHNVGDNPQTPESSKPLWAELEEREYNVRWIGNVGNGGDDTASITSVFNYAKVNNVSKIIFPQMTYRISNLFFEDFNNIMIYFKGSLLKGLSDIENMLTVFRNNTDLELTNFTLDGNNTFYRGMRILGGNTDLRIHNFNILDISPKIQLNPRQIDSVAIDLAVGMNHDIQIYNFAISGVTNNQNGAIGDSIGSARGILVQVLTEDITHSNIKFSNFTIEHVKGEDGDAIQCIGNHVNGVKFDVQFEDFSTDHCTRRGLKTQSCYGVGFNNFKIKHTDRSYNMSTGISAYCPGNTFTNFEIDVRAIKGFEFSPYTVNDQITKVSRARVIVDDVLMINGSYVFAIDILNSEFLTAKNIEFDNLYVLAPSTGMVVRTYSRGLKVNNANFNSYSKSQQGISLAPFTTSAQSSDGDMIGHSRFEIDNIIADGFPFWAGDGASSIKSGVVGHLQSRDESVNPYETIRYKRTNVQSLHRTFYGNGVPASGTFLQGDYMFFGLVDAEGYTGAICKTAGTPGVWIKTGLTQTTT